MRKRSRKNGKRITLTVERFEGSELHTTWKQLFSDLSNASDEIRVLSFNFLKLSPELIRFESSIASGAVVTILLKPSDFFLDLCLAVRTGKFDFLIIKYGHSFSSVDSRLVELPSLSTLEKLPVKAGEIEK